MRWLRLAATALLAVGHATACSGDDPDDDPAPADDLERAAAYLESAHYRREILEGSLVNPDNGYSKRRLERYTEDQWGALPEWNPRVRPVLTSDLGQPVPTPDETWRSLDVEVELDDEALRELGQRAFATYPNQVETALVAAIADIDAPGRFGLWIDGERVGGLVWVELPDGVQPAFTCSSCHASQRADGGGLTRGAPNHRFDYGAVLDAHHGGPTAAGRWGPGRVDVTPDDLDNPTVMADLRAVRFQARLNRAATIRNDLMALVMRLETAVIVSSNEAIRPPRTLVLGLSWYLWDLGEQLPLPADGDGREVFDAECGGCHIPPGLAGPPVALEAIGTDPTVGESPWRTTGALQTPSLRGVATRGRLMSVGDIESFEVLLDDARGAPGHRYGGDLSERDEEALLDFLRALE